MIKIVNKIMQAGKHIGYMLDDSGLLEPVLSKGLYAELYLQGLLEAGYKFFDYNPDNIEDVNGHKIVDLPEIESTIGEDEMFSLEEIAMTALSDVECARYYTHKNDSVIDFAQPDEVLIHTREELVQYLEAVGGFIQRNGFAQDYRPLNSFVAKEALFSCDEIKKDSNVRALMEIVMGRHKFRDFASYQQLCAWLRSKGVLEKSNPTYIEFMAAYYSWGIDGIKDSCVNFSTKMMQDTRFDIYNEPLKMANYSHLDNRDERQVIFDSRGVAHYLKRNTDMSDLQTFDREAIVFPHAGDIFKIMRGSSTWGAPYKVMKGYVSRVTDRMYHSFISEDGYPYQFRSTHDKVILFSGSIPTFRGSNFSIASIHRGISFSLEDVQTENDYYIWNLAAGKAIDIAKSKEMKVPVKSSYDLLIKEGVNPVAAIKSLANDIYSNNNNCESNDFFMVDNKNREFFGEAFEKFCKPIPEELKAKYEITEGSYSSIEEFIEFAGDQMDDEEARLMGGKSGASDMARMQAVMNASSGTKDIDPKKYISDLKFVKRCLDHEININFMGDGYLKDTGTATNDIIRIMVTLVYIKLGQNPQAHEVADLLGRLEEYNLIDLDKTFKKRDEAYKGYLKDVAILRNKRANFAWAWAYCTKIFREISNAPVEEQRHFAMEICVVKDKNIREAIRNCVAEADLSGMDAYTAEMINRQSYYIAANLFFSILSGKIDDSFLQNGAYVLNFPTGIEDASITVKIPTSVYNMVMSYDVAGNTKYITLYDYCYYELSGNGAFSMFLVNGNVNPWYVTPKTGYTIPTMNFIVNYNREAAFAKFSDAWKNHLVEVGGKGAVSLVELTSDRYIPDISSWVELNKPEFFTADTIDCFLSESQLETFEMYKTRWFYKANVAKAEGNILKTLRLKQDVLWEPLAKYFDVTVNAESDTLASPEENVTATNYVALVDPNMLTYREAEEVKTLVGTSFKRYTFIASAMGFDSLYRWDKLLRGQFIPTRTIYMGGTSMVISHMDKDPEIVQFGSLTVEILERMSDVDLCYQLSDNKFLFKALNGDYVLEV